MKFYVKYNLHVGYLGLSNVRQKFAVLHDFKLIKIAI